MNAGKGVVVRRTLTLIRLPREMETKTMTKMMDPRMMMNSVRYILRIFGVVAREYQPA